MLILKEHLWFIFSLTAAVMWGIHYATAGELSKTLPASLMTIAYLSLVTISSIVLVIFFKTPQGLIQALISHTNYTNLWLLGIMVVTGCISNFLIFTAIEDSTATKASIVEITYPFFVALFSLLLYRENTLSFGTLVGGGLIFSGIIMVIRG